MTDTTTRRHFVRTAAVAGAGCALSPALFAKDSNQLKLGIASYTFRNFTRAQLIGFMKELQVFALNAKYVKDHLPAEPEPQRVALHEYRAAGIALHAAGAIYFPKDDESEIREKFDYCKRAGVRVLVAGDPALPTLPRLERFARQFDILVAIHNHGPEDKTFPSPLDVLKAVKNMDRRMGCCIDVGHTVRTGTDVVQAICEAGPRLFNVHMKDLADFNEKDSQVAVGDGKMPVREIFEALLAIHYQGFVDLEYEIHPDDPMPGVRRSFTYMRSLLASMNAPR